MLTICLPVASLAQERWFQIELSIFSNESLTSRSEETWLPGVEELEFPAGMARLKQLKDILLTDDLIFVDDKEPPRELDEAALTQQQIARIGPEPPTSGTGFRFYDFQRDEFLQLPASASDFRQTNRALRQSPDHRLLFHGLWRQPVKQRAQAQPIYVSGGEMIGQQPELSGSVTIRFNTNEDRVVIDADIWLSDFGSAAGTSGWRLPQVPAAVLDPMTGGSATDTSSDEASSQPRPSRVYHMQQSREMRSTEFHYLDHPALGIVIMVEPYEVPRLPLSDGLPPLEDDL